LIRIGHGVVAGAQRPLGRFDQAVDVIEAFGLLDAQPIEQREDHQRDQPLGRRVGVVEGAGGNVGSQRLGDLGLVAGEIVARHRAADAVEIGGDLAADVAAIKVVEAGMGEVLERRRQRLLFQYGADVGRLAVDQERRSEARHVHKLGQMLLR